MLPRTKLLLAAIIVCVLVIGFGLRERDEVAEDHVPPAATEQQVVSTPLAEWKEFQSVTNKFAVLLPSLPQHASDSVALPSGQGMIKYDMYLAQEKIGSTFMISLIQYPENYDTASTADLLDGVMKEMMNGNPNNKLKLVEKSLFQSYPALDFTIQNNEVYIHCKAFLRHKTLVVLTAIDRDPQVLDTKFLKFANSFNWNEPEAVVAQ